MKQVLKNSINRLVFSQCFDLGLKVFIVTGMVLGLSVLACPVFAEERAREWNTFSSASEPVVLPPSDFSGMLDIEDGHETWIDGNTIRYFMASFREQNDSPLVKMLDELNGVRIARDHQKLYITIEYSKALKIKLRPIRKTPSWKLYGMEIPKISKFEVEAKDGVIEVREVESSSFSEAWKLQVKLPFLPDTIYVRKASIDLVNGDISVAAGFFGNLVAVVADAKIRETDFSYMGISFWQSVLESLRFSRWFGVQ